MTHNKIRICAEEILFNATSTGEVRLGILSCAAYNGLANHVNTNFVVLGTNWNGVALANLTMHLFYRLWHWSWATSIPAKIRLMISMEHLALVAEEEDVAVDTTADGEHVAVDTAADGDVPPANATLTTD